MAKSRRITSPQTPLGTYYAQLNDERSPDPVIAAAIRQLCQAEDRRSHSFKIVSDSRVISRCIEETYALDSSSIKQKLNLFSPLFSQENNDYTLEEKEAYDALMQADCEEVDIVGYPPSERRHNLFSLLIQHSMCPTQSLLEKMTLPGIQRAYKQTTYEWTREQSQIILDYHTRHRQEANHPASAIADFTVNAKTPEQQSRKRRLG